MEIQTNILKYYLKNVMFITGTAYAGKSTMCKMLSKKYNLYHCEENYNSDVMFKVITQKNQPNLNYFNTKKDWQEFLNRKPDEYEKWIIGNKHELAGFEVAELIRISQNKKVIVDTNIPIKLLKKIASYNQITLMLSPQSMSVDKFFDRKDSDKLFLKEQIMNNPNPEKTMANFKACIAKANDVKYYNEYVESGCFVVYRKNCNFDTKLETMKILAKHFKLTEK